MLELGERGGQGLDAIQPRPTECSRSSKKDIGAHSSRACYQKGGESLTSKAWRRGGSPVERAGATGERRRHVHPVGRLPPQWFRRSFLTRTRANADAFSAGRRREARRAIAAASKRDGTGDEARWW